MPKLKKQFDPWEKYRGAVVGRMLVLDYGLAELAGRMGLTIPTVRRYIKEPGRMSLDQMRQMNRVLDIEAADARDLLAYK